MKKKWMCRECYKLYTDEEVSHNEMKCICNKYGSEGLNIVPIDEPIAADIVKMNKKGYYTRFCCAGHYIPEEHEISPFYVCFDIADARKFPWLMAHVPDGLMLTLIPQGDDGYSSYPAYMLRLGPVRNAIVEDLYPEDVEGEEVAGTSEELYNEYQAYRDEIIRYAFKKWVQWLPDLSKDPQRSF